MKCLICLKDTVESFCDNSFLRLPVFFCDNCNVYFSGESEILMKEKCNDIYSNEFWGNENIWDAKKIIENNYHDDDSIGKKRTWKSQYAFCKEYLNNPKEILEIGAGQGQASYWFEEAHHIVTAIEPDPNNAKLIDEKLRNGKCVCGDAENFNINKEFDIVWVSHVLEHMISPNEFLKNLNKNLKNNGMLFIEVPNCENKLVLTTSIEKVPHTFHFSMKSLRILLQKNGFNIKKGNYLRPAKKIDGLLNKISESAHPYYPRVIADAESGKYFRIIAEKI